MLEQNHLDPFTVLANMRNNRSRGTVRAVTCGRIIFGILDAKPPGIDASQLRSLLGFRTQSSIGALTALKKMDLVQPTKLTGAGNVYACSALPALVDVAVAYNLERAEIVRDSLIESMTEQEVLRRSSQLLLIAHGLPLTMGVRDSVEAVATATNRHPQSILFDAVKSLAAACNVESQVDREVTASVAAASLAYSLPTRLPSQAK